MKKQTFENNKIQLIRILDLYKALTELLYEESKDTNGQKEMKYPAKVSYAINKNLQKLVPFVADFEGRKQEIIQKFGGTVDQEKQSYVYESPEKEAECNKEIMALIYEEKEVEIHKIDLDMLGMAMITPFKVNQLEELGMLVVE